MIRRIALPTAFAVLAILIWYYLVHLIGIPSYLVPSPSQVWSNIATDGGYFVGHLEITLLEAYLGFALAILIGFFVGSLFALLGWLETMLLPYAIASQAIPVVALAPLLVLWLGTGIASKVAMATLLCFFPMVVNTTIGLRSVTVEQLSLFWVYDATVCQIFWKLRLPASLPFVGSGMRISAAMAMIGAIVAEYAGADRGIGYVIMQSTYRVDTAQLFTAIFFAAFGGICIFLSAIFIEHAFLKRSLRRPTAHTMEVSP